MLDVIGLTVKFPTLGVNAATPFTDFQFSIGTGEIVGLCGPSGCGKTTFATALLGILEPPGFVAGGSAVFTRRNGESVDLFALSEKYFRQLRGKEIGMIFQDPVASLHPANKISAQFTDTLRAHNTRLSRAQCLKTAEGWFDKMGFSEPKKIIASYPFELSGGMCQRVTIAMALALHPSLLIADEPTTALDVKNEEQILTMIRDARDRFGTSVILISHDLMVVTSVADRTVRLG